VTSSTGTWEVLSRFQDIGSVLVVPVAFRG
jgi:hypothetical protein